MDEKKAPPSGNPSAKTGYKILSSPQIIHPVATPWKSFGGKPETTLSSRTPDRIRKPDEAGVVCLLAKQAPWTCDACGQLLPLELLTDPSQFRHCPSGGRPWWRPGDVP